jgi:hypothetical protein
VRSPDSHPKIVGDSTESAITGLCLAGQARMVMVIQPLELPLRAAMCGRGFRALPADAPVSGNITGRPPKSSKNAGLAGSVLPRL